VGYVSALESRFRLIVRDRLGHGESDEGRVMRETSNDLFAVMRFHDVGPIT
jgi:hypothetical protein